MPETVAQFQLQERLGSNPLGDLYRARDQETGRTAAVRVLHASVAGDTARRTALLDRARMLTRLEHPSIAAVYDCGVDGDVAFIASEFVAGEPLSAVISGAPLPTRRAQEIAVQAADGLAAVHALGLSHADLSADAIVLTPKGSAKVVGLEVAAVAPDAASERIDMAALGGILFQMVTGRPLRTGWPSELRLPSIPRELQPVLQRLVASPPEQPYASMALAAAALREATLRQAASASDAIAVSSPAAAGRTQPSGLVAMLVGVLVVLAIAWYFAAR